MYVLSHSTIPSSLFQAFRWWGARYINHKKQTQKEKGGIK